MVSPLISLLRPVSPLAWLPIGLLVFKAANPAAIWTIFICSIWPMIINTAVGVQRVPEDYLNVARVLNLSEWKVITRILFPAVLPYMLTGVRLSVGTAWLVIVAAEMLTGGVGIGFWVWDEWNNLNVKHILIAIFVIGIVGLLLEQLLMAMARRFSFDDALSDERIRHEQASSSAERRDGVRRPRRAASTRCARSTSRSQGRVRHADRPLGLRQVDAAQPDRRAAAADERRAAAATTARSPRPARSARWCSRTTRCCPG